MRMSTSYTDCTTSLKAIPLREFQPKLDSPVEDVGNQQLKNYESLSQAHVMGAPLEGEVASRRSSTMFNHTTTTTELATLPSSKGFHSHDLERSSIRQPLALLRKRKRDSSSKVEKATYARRNKDTSIPSDRSFVGSQTSLHPLPSVESTPELESPPRKARRTRYQTGPLTRDAPISHVL